MKAGARLGEAINQGLESGLQTNIFDLITGKEKKVLQTLY